MLNWEQIAQRIQNPNLCNAEEIPELKDLCEKYPYSQVFPMLYLKVLSDVKYIHFEEELEKYAYRITDRVQLYNLLNDNFETHEQKFEDEKVAQVIHINENTIELEKGQGVELELDQNSAVFSEDEKTDAQSAEFANEEIDNQDIIDQDSPIFDDDKLDKQILAATVGSSYQIEEISEEINSEKLPVFDFSTETQTIAEKEVDLTLNQKNQSQSIDFNQNRSFLDWLKLSSKTEIAHDELELEIESENEYEVSYIEFEKPKKEFFSPVKKAKESLSEDTLPVSETLAKIYEVQGNIPKSISVYEQLSLIIPEKKTYFATQIKKLKKKLN